MALFIHLPWLFIFGLLGNIVSFMVFLAPTPTFYKIIKKKSTEGFQCLPYLASLFSSMLWIYYAYFKSNAYFLITINSCGCVIETIYIALYIAYAPEKARIFTVRLLLFFNVGCFSLIALLSYFYAEGCFRVALLGWICLVFSICVFVAPLSIMRQVIRTKSVEFMPLSLSLFLTLNAIIWFFYGLLLKDFYIALPNIIGFVFGVLQMALYIIYKNYEKIIKVEKELPTIVDKQGAIQSAEIHPVCSLPISDENEEEKDTNLHEETNHGESIDASNQV